MTTLTGGLTSVDLDPDLIWIDEFAWSPVAQSVERSITGALLIDAGANQAGRPITLQPADDLSGWMPRSAIESLQAMASVPGLTMTLVFGGNTYSVMWRSHEGAPISAEPVAAFSDPAPDDWYRATLRLMTV